MNIPVNVYAESTPNPSAMKFVASIPLLKEGVVEYLKGDDTSASPLCTELFKFSGIKSVFITANFITVSKEGDIEWFELNSIIREFIRGYLMTGEKVFIKNPFQEPNQTEQITTPLVANINLSELENKIISTLEEYVKPAVEQDGGAIHFKAFHEGVVTVTLKGSCSGCPSSTLTLKSGIENLLKQLVPEVTEVVAEAG